MLGRLLRPLYSKVVAEREATMEVHIGKFEKAGRDFTEEVEKIDRKVRRETVPPGPAGDELSTDVSRPE